MIYFARSGPDGPVKIGFAVDVAERIHDIQAGNPHKLDVLRVIEGDRRKEAWLHQHFAAARIRGEWFAFDSAMLTVEPPEPDPMVKARGTKLGAYLRDRRIKQADFAVQVGVHTITVSKWCAGMMRPRWSQMDAIKRATDGAVTADDFSDISQAAS